MSTSSSNPFYAYKINTPADYRPEWDVVSVNQKISHWLVDDIRRLKGQRAASSGQKIPVLLSSAGYGKTHLYARISHDCEHEIFFVFLPPVEDPERPAAHIRWHVVESLFRSPSGGRVTPLSRALARLCHASFLSYFNWLPPSIAEHCEALRQRLQEDDETALDIIAEVKQPQPFVRLAESLVAAWPELRGEVIKAFVLGWSSTDLATLARRWLRGESLAETDLGRLGLPEEPPSMHDILRVLPAILQYQTPVVLCFDQLESVLSRPDAIPRVVATLMEVLQTIPVYLLLNCLQDRWPLLFSTSTDSFKQRIEPFTLTPLNEEQAVELVRQRLPDWRSKRPDATWPFDERSIRRLATESQLGPRGLIQLCAAAFEKWSDKGGNERIALKLKDEDGEDLDVLFVRAWEREREAIRRDPARTPSDTQEERLYRGVREALGLAREAKRELGGVHVVNVQENVLPSTAAVPKLSLKVVVKATGKEFAVLVPVTKIDTGTQFRYYFDAIQDKLDQVAGVLLVHPRGEPSMGPKTQTKIAFDEAVRRGRLCVFPLCEQTEAAECLECLLTFLDRAAAEELQLNGQTLSVKDCQDFILKTGVLDRLALYRDLGAWRESEKVAAAPPAPPPPAAPSPPRAKATRESIVSPSVPEPVELATAVASVGEKAALDWAQQCLAELASKLKLWGFPVEPVGAEVGPTFARLKVRPASGRTTFKKVRDTAVDLKIHLRLSEAPLISDQAGYISVDVQRLDRQTVTLDEVLAEPPRELNDQPAFPVGKDVAGHTYWLNLADPSDCHLLVAGTTGSGKSEFLKVLLAGLARRLGPHELQFVLIDPKQVTFNFAGRESPYVPDPIACTAEEAGPLIERCFTETEARYDLLRRRNRENISELTGADARPHVVMVIDEFADLMADRETKKTLEGTLKRIGAKARAAGIHVVLATQRPEAPGVVTPQLRSNLPGRICFRVAGEGDSRLMLGSPEAAYLLGKGDLLWRRGGGLLRLQSPRAGKAELAKALRLS